MSSQTYPFITSLSRILHCAGIFVCIPALIVILTIDVSLRYIFNSPLLWGGEVSALILSLVFIASLPQITDTDSHIRMDMLYRLMPPKVKALADGLAGLCGTLFALMLTYQSFKSCAEMYHWQEGAEMIDIPYWPFVLFAGVCGLILSLQFITQMILPFVSRAAEEEN